MASRYGAFTRSVRSAVHSSGSGRSSFRTAGSRPAPSNPRPHFNDRRSPSTNNAASLRRRWAETLIPLHNAVADAKLVSHLSVNTRDRSTLSLDKSRMTGIYSLCPSWWKTMGLQIFLDAAFLNFCVRSPWPDGYSDRAFMRMATACIHAVPVPANFVVVYMHGCWSHRPLKCLSSMVNPQ